MEHGRGNAKFIICTLAAAVLAILQAVAAKDYTVGGDDPYYNPYFPYKWHRQDSASYSYDKWSSNQTFLPGDSLIFYYNTGYYNVEAVDESTYFYCLTTSGANVYNSGYDTITLLTPGNYYFISTYVIGDCSSYGLKMQVYVITPPVNAPPPLPAVSPSAGRPPTPPVGIPPISPTTPSVAPPAKPPGSSTIHIAAICGALLGAALIVLAVGLFIFCFLKRRKNALIDSSHKPAKSAPGEDSEASLSVDTNCRPYTVKELSTITKHFNASELLSSGAFGDVYKGTPPNGAPLVAVKRIKVEHDHARSSFLAEVNSLRETRHRNLLQLRGWCEAKEGLFLVYDFMSNSSLDKWLFPNPNPHEVAVFHHLSWYHRHSILAGVASGLNYLHGDWVQCVLHRDIKSSNIMLDASFNACLGDFGLARLVDHEKQQKTTMLAGTLGYIAPEMHYTGKATKETDIYAFGVLVLEVVCGRRPFGDLQPGDEVGDYLLLERVWCAHEAGWIGKMVDPALLSEESVSENEVAMMASVLKLGLLCCLPNPSERPSMRVVNNWFQGSIESGVMEPFPWLPAVRPPPPAPPARMSVTNLSSAEGTSTFDTNSSRSTTRSV